MKQPPPASGVIHPIQARKAFGEDHEHQASPTTLVGLDASTALLRRLDGTELAVTVVDPERFRATLDRADVCRLNRATLLLVNEWYRVIGVAVGPAVPPLQLEVLWGVSRFEDGSVVEIPSPDEGVQPAWWVFALEAHRSRSHHEQRRGATETRNGESL